MIPKVLHRTIPESGVADECEQWWSDACALHPDWRHVTWQDPLDPDRFPLTAHLWPRCATGAQRAGLVRLEVVYRYGGVYIDSDVECYRPFDPLLGCSGFAGWEDARTVPDAVFGAEKGDVTVWHVFEAAERRFVGGGRTWADDAGAWSTGPGAFTEVLPGSPWLLLPPGSFYPYHWTGVRDGRGRDHISEQPWAFCAHHWHGSWLPAHKRPGAR